MKNDNQHDQEGYTPMPEENDPPVNKNDKAKSSGGGISHEKTAEITSQEKNANEKPHAFESQDLNDEDHRSGAAVNTSVSVAVGAFVIMLILVVSGVFVFYQSEFYQSSGQSDERRDDPQEAQGDQAQVIDSLPANTPPIPPTPPPYTEPSE